MNTQTNYNKNIQQFLMVGKTEGYSYLVLLFIAMPLKYIFHLPIFVRIVGSIHGFLFVAFVLIILYLLIKKQINFKNAIIAFLLSLIPFGTFYLEKTIPNKNS